MPNSKEIKIQISFQKSISEKEEDQLWFELFDILNLQDYKKVKELNLMSEMLMTSRLTI